MLANGPEMDWTPGDLWRVGLSLPAGGVYEYKYVLVAGGAGSRHALAWQRGNNSVLALGATETEAEVPTARTCAWQRVLPCFLLLRACSALTGAWRSERARPQKAWSSLAVLTCAARAQQSGRSVQVVDNWEGAPGAVVVVAGRAATREGRLLAWANEMEATIASQVCLCPGPSPVGRHTFRLCHFVKGQAAQKTWLHA